METKKEQPVNRRKEKLETINECMDQLAIQKGPHNSEHRIIYTFMEIVKEMIKDMYEDVNEL